MERLHYADTGLTGSRLIYGCMRLAEAGGDDAAAAALDGAVEAGIDQFDHADIYGGGECETLFGRFLASRPGLRERLVIIGKCGVRFATPTSPKRYDLSGRHIAASVDASLERLGCDYLDLLLLHRPDYLFDAREAADTLNALRESGKVRHVGASNFSLPQIELLKDALGGSLVAHQLEINLRNPAALTDGSLDHCQRTGCVPQAWSPLAGVLAADASPALASELARQAAHYGTDAAGIAIAWLLRHPARIAPVIGSRQPARINAAAAAARLDYTRDDWYRLWEARQGQPVA